MQLLTAQELAQALKVTTDTIWRYTRTGRIPSVRLRDREYRYDLEEVMAALTGAGGALSAAAAESLSAPDLPKLAAFAGKLKGGGGS